MHCITEGPKPLLVSFVKLLDLRFSADATGRLPADMKEGFHQVLGHTAEHGSWMQSLGENTLVVSAAGLVAQLSLIGQP